MATAKYKKGKNGYYKTNVWDGTYQNGKKHYVVLRSKKSSRDLERMKSEYEEAVRNRRVIRKDSCSFLSYARSWLSVYKSGRENNTKEMYRNVIEKHLAFLDGVPLHEIDRIHLQQALNAADGHPRTQQLIRMTFRQIIESAVADHLFSANVADDMFRNVENIKYRSPEKRALSKPERDAVLKADFKEMDKAFVYLLYGCGLRRGEALALTIFDIDLKRRELIVNKSHELIEGNVNQKVPKSQNSFRTVPIPSNIFPAIEHYVQKLRAAGRSYLFTMQNGLPMTKSSYRKMWERILKAMQEVSSEPITGLTAHIFRHNYCTMLCYEIPSISIKHIARLLGDSEKMVLNVYSHILLEKEDAVAAVDRAL